MAPIEHQMTESNTSNAGCLIELDFLHEPHVLELSAAELSLPQFRFTGNFGPWHRKYSTRSLVGL